MTERTTAIESYKNLLCWSLRESLAGRSERQIRGGEFFCSAPLSELEPYTDLGMPKHTQMLVDIEIRPPSYTRLLFDFEFVRINRLDMTAIYRATCED
jgi:hypothetical protein